jgi:signal transduction histidine kinase/PAS domain-containing protein/ActR/RegA family two-component response regulator
MPDHNENKEELDVNYLNYLPNSVGFFRYENGRYHFLYANEAGRKLFGVTGDKSENDLTAGTFEELYPDDRDKIKLILYKATVSGGVYRELVRLNVDGEYRWMAVAVNAELQPGGTAIVCIVYADVNTPIMRQNKLDSAYMRLLDVVNNAMGGVISFETLNNRILVPSYVSQGVYHMLKGSEQEVRDLYNKAPMTCVHPEDREKTVRTLEDALRNMRGFQFNVRLRTIPGEYIWVSCTGTIDVIENRRSVYIALMETSEDAQYLQIEKQIIEKFVNKQYDCIYLIDGRSNEYKLLNSRTYGQFYPNKGLDYEKEILAVIQKFVVPEEQEQFEQRMKLSSILETLSLQQDVEYFCTMKVNGKPFYRKIWLSWVDAETKMFAMILCDVTEEYRRSRETMEVLHSALKAAEQSNTAKTEFLSRMSHDIRTPLNAIIGYIEMGKDDPSLTPELKEYLMKAESSSKFLLTLINDILNMSWIESGKLVLKEEPFNIYEFAANIKSIVWPQCEAKQITYIDTVEEGLSSCYVGDELKIQQIVLNIIGNAVKFTPANGKIYFRITSVNEKGIRGIQFEIEDTGCGISEEFLPHIFNAFEQENRTLDSEIKGTGLGLAICRSFVDMMNGTIYVTSKVNQGTKFTVILPLCASTGNDQVLPVSQVKSTSSIQADFHGKHVLLVEDNAVNMEIAVHVLKRANLVIDQAVNGKEACEQFSRSPLHYYAAVIMDVRMPVMNGYEATKNIRSMEREDNNVPIIAMSANAFEEDIREALHAGMNAYTIKPIDVPSLYQTLKQYVK